MSRSVGVLFFSEIIANDVQKCLCSLVDIIANSGEKRRRCFFSEVDAVGAQMCRLF